MPRSARVAPDEMVFHVINRGVGRMVVSEKEQDYIAFERIVEGSSPGAGLLVLFDVKPLHVVLWPKNDVHMAAFMQRLTITHVRCWQEHRHCVGEGHVYQGCYKSFPVQSEDYL